VIHLYQQNDYNIVLDVNSGAVHVVDLLTYKILGVYSPSLPPEENRQNIIAALASCGTAYPLDEIEEALAEIESLRAQNLLYAPAADIEALSRREPVVKALCLHIAHDCNLRCRYCFAGTGEYHGARSLMSVDVGKKAIDFLIASSGRRRNLEVDFFGGEPTLNFDTVKAIVAYGRAEEKKHNKNIRFTLTTNGVLLDEEMQAYINENMHNVVLSLDGRRETNDRMRPKAGGQGSYDGIVPRFQALAESRGQQNYYVRGTFTRENLDFSQDVLHLADLGFRQVSVEPVVASPDEPYALQPADLPVIFAQYEALAAEMLARKRAGKAFNFFHFMIDLSGGPCAAKRLAGCGAGTEYLAVTPEGDLYPCHQFVGTKDFQMGTVFDGVTNPALRSSFAGCNVYTKPECGECWAKFYCSGGCAANAYHTNGRIDLPYQLGCELQRKRTECAIMLKAAELAEL